MKLNKLVSTLDMDHETWLQYRKKGIGGSDAGSICGLNPYSTATSVFQDKTQMQAEEKADNEAMRQGRDLEEYVARRFTEETGKKVRRANAIFYKEEQPFMFDGFKRFWKGLMQMFGYTTLKQIVGKDITLSDKMIDAINEWKQMLNGQADWITDSLVSLGIEEGICREFADCALVEMETSVSNERLDKIYQKNIASLNENLQEGLALGSLVLKPLGEAAAEFISADKIIPISFGDDGKPIDIAFLTVSRSG